jgi:hypothetical protein
MKIIEVKCCGGCPYLSPYDWQLPTKCTLFDFIIKDESIVHPNCKLKDKEE